MASRKTSNVNIVRNMIISALLLGLFAMTGTFLVAYTFDNTIERINENKRLALLNALHILIPPSEHDNDIFSDIITVKNKALLGTAKAINIYRARKQNQPVAAIINSVAPEGYNGNIELLVAIRFDGTLAGVRVVQHKETPGLGDAIEEKRSNWILGFAHRSLTNPDKKGWAVKRDGGEFDQFTGATITPRAVINAIKNGLLFFAHNKQSIFSHKGDKPKPSKNNNFIKKYENITATEIRVMINHL